MASRQVINLHDLELYSLDNCIEHVHDITQTQRMEYWQELENERASLRGVEPLDLESLQKNRLRKAKDRLMMICIKKDRDALKDTVKELENQVREEQFRRVQAEAKVNELKRNGSVHKRGGGRPWPRKTMNADSLEPSYRNFKVT